MGRRTPGGILLVFLGLSIAVFAVLVSAFAQAGVATSAATGGSRPSVSSVEVLFGMIAILVIGAILISFGLTTSPRVRDNQMQTPKPKMNGDYPDLSFTRVALFLATLGAGLISMGVLIPRPYFVFTQDGPAMLGSSLLAVPEGLIVLGVGLVVVAIGLSFVRRSIRSHRERHLSSRHAN